MVQAESKVSPVALRVSAGPGTMRHATENILPHVGQTPK